jgi:hypothetical protein
MELAGREDALACPRFVYARLRQDLPSSRHAEGMPQESAPDDERNVERVGAGGGKVWVERESHAA